jgi:hypothetical protein
MSKRKKKKKGKQLRRSISLAPGAYEELRLLAERYGASMAAYIEGAIHLRAIEACIHVDHDAARERSRKRYAEMHERKLADVERRRAEAFG